MGININPESFVGDEIIYLLQSRANNAVVVVSENDGTMLIDNRQLKIIPQIT
jgi:hypothetical protein